ncbi:MAG: (Fe-S)-binding protein, partial [Deltaproteobacteria bacterium]|nr:(Fe-S)-binding protein [Deltaproteobacteria bacterium]
CAACDINCKRVMDLDIIGVLEALREEACERGYGPLPAHKEFITSIQQYDNVWKQPRTRRANWARKLDIKDLSKPKEKAEVLYFVGCTYAYKPGVDVVPIGTAEVLKKAGVDFGILGVKELCCGGICDNVGDKKSFEEIAEKNLKMFKETGAKTIITNCPGCSMTFSEKYARHLKINTSDLDYQVVHATEYTNNLIKEGKIKLTKNVDMKVTYHDPCHLGRRNEPYKHWEGKRVEFGLTDPPRELNRGVDGGYEPPREILKAIPGLELAEMERIKEYSWCCGSGGGAKSAFPDFAIATGQERIEEAKTTGASAIVSACPWCETHLQDYIDSMEESMKVYSFIELVKQSME